MDLHQHDASAVKRGLPVECTQLEACCAQALSTSRLSAPSRRPSSVARLQAERAFMHTRDCAASHPMLVRASPSVSGSMPLLWCEPLLGTLPVACAPSLY